MDCTTYSLFVQYRHKIEIKNHCHPVKGGACILGVQIREVQLCGACAKINTCILILAISFRMLVVKITWFIVCSQLIKILQSDWSVAIQ